MHPTSRNYGSSLLQNLVQQAFPSGFMEWGGQRISTSTFLLDISGLTFGVQVVALMIIGPYADYGTWRPYILIFWTVVGIAASLAFFGIIHASQWALAAGFYVLGTVAYNACYAFWQGAFPGLVGDLPEVAESERRVADGTQTPEAHAALSTLERSKLANISSIYSAFGSCLSIILCIAIAKGMGIATTEANTKVYSVIIGYFGITCIVSSLPWYVPFPASASPLDMS